MGTETVIKCFLIFKKIQEETQANTLLLRRSLILWCVCVSLADETDWNVLFFLSFSRWNKKVTTRFCSVSMFQCCSKKTQESSTTNSESTMIWSSQKKQHMHDKFLWCILSDHDFCSESSKRICQIFLKEKKNNRFTFNNLKSTNNNQNTHSSYGCNLNFFKKIDRKKLDHKEKEKKMKWNNFTIIIIIIISQFEALWCSFMCSFSLWI